MLKKLSFIDWENQKATTGGLWPEGGMRPGVGLEGWGITYHTHTPRTGAWKCGPGLVGGRELELTRLFCFLFFSSNSFIGSFFLVSCSYSWCPILIPVPKTSVKDCASVKRKPEKNVLSDPESEKRVVCLMHWVEMGDGLGITGEESGFLIKIQNLCHMSV